MILDWNGFSESRFEALKYSYKDDMCHAPLNVGAVLADGYDIFIELDSDSNERCVLSLKIYAQESDECQMFIGELELDDSCFDMPYAQFVALAESKIADHIAVTYSE